MRIIEKKGEMMDNTFSSHDGYITYKYDGETLQINDEKTETFIDCNHCDALYLAKIIDCANRYLREE